MEEDDKLRLSSNHVYLVQQVNVNDIKDHLIEQSVINDEQSEELDPIRVTSFEAARKLIRFLKKSPNPKAYAVFCQALEETGSSHIVERLNETDVDAVREKNRIEKKQEDDQMQKLQTQVWMQCEMLMDLKRQVDELKRKEDKSRKKEKKYEQLENAMKEKGISDDDVIKDLINYMKNGGFSDSPKQQDVSHSSFGAVAEGGGSRFMSIKFNSKKTSKRQRDQQKHPSDSIARALGIDIAFYMVSCKSGRSVPAYPNDYALVMRRMVDELNEQHEDLFMKLVKDLDLDQHQGFDAFVKIANELFFEDGQPAFNWGRVVVLYAYGGWMALKSGYSDDSEQSQQRIRMIGDFVGYYVDQKLGSWITEKGGWDKLREWMEGPRLDREKAYWAAMMISGIGFGVAVGISWFRG